MEDRYTLRYSGRQADSEQMDYYEAASVILAFGDFVGVVARAAYGRDVKLETSVTSPKDGCISFDFLLVTGGVISAVTGPITPQSLWSLFRDSIEAWRFLRGKPPIKTEHTENGFKITNTDGDVIVFNNSSVNLVLENSKAGQAAEKIFNDPLSTAADTVEVESREMMSIDRSTASVSVNESEATYFRDISQGNVVLDNTYRITLSIISPVFLDGNKWRFSDGSSKFSAAIEDEKFLKRVDDGEAFAKNEFLVVDLHILQEATQGGRMRTTRTVKKVIKHVRLNDTRDMFPKGED